ncbi:hypothetical protein BOX15_Mlig001922g5 [Macrostomum lignano]|uniref:Alpha-1,3-mannosyl-glycoprotein 2-beta-N-acetylglucosaminyltransferase n=2 Tax=Macrostomum lignano TaxID=282301 RepID=A0A267GSA8_9PLAT|nr:hypothetical protein BOX15_Mlig001922g5 [Macrostomum lignano]
MNMQRFIISRIVCVSLRPGRPTKTKLIVLTAAALLVSNLLLNLLPDLGLSSIRSKSATEVSIGAEDLAALKEVGDISAGGGGGRYRRISQHLSGSDGSSGDRSVTVTAWSGCQFTALAIDDVLLVNQSTQGLHIFIVNQATASLMGHQVFSSLDELKPLLTSVTAGRLLILTSVQKFRRTGSADEAAALRLLGSSGFQIVSPKKPDMEVTASWVLIAFAKIGRIDEQLMQSRGRQLRLSTQVRLVSEDDPICPSWPPSEDTTRRRRFCQLAEGFNNVCDCSTPAAISFQSRPAPWSTHGVVPLTVLSSNQPQFLFRTLSSLLSIQSLNVSQTHVMLRGFFEEPRLICDLLKLAYTQRKQVSASLANLYRLGMADSFHLFPTASFVILLEGDVDSSPDLVEFFNRTLPLMRRDPNLFCIGAWNDQSFTHTSQEPGLLLRTQQVPLKAVAIRRTTWESQLNEQWPEGPIDLASWLGRVMGPRRYCLRPALSRAFVYSQSLRLIDRLRPAYRTESASFCIDEEAHSNYDSRLQGLIDSSVGFNSHFARGCQSAVLAATSLASRTVNSTLPSLLISARASNIRVAQQFWTRVARCFSLNAGLTCLYKGTCQINFQRFILLVLFRPLAPFRLPPGSEPDLTIQNVSWGSRKHRRHSRSPT